MHEIALDDEERDEVEQLLIDLLYGAPDDRPAPNLAILFDVLTKVEATQH